MERKLKGYFCPFARRMCYEGLVKVSGEPNLVQCQFWADGPPGRCRLLPAVGGLTALNEIPGMLQSLASRGGE